MKSGGGQPENGVCERQRSWTAIAKRAGEFIVVGESAKREREEDCWYWEDHYWKQNVQGSKEEM